MSTLNINGRQRSVGADFGTPVLCALRDTLGMTRAKFDRGAAFCDACTAPLDSHVVRSHG